MLHRIFVPSLVVLCTPLAANAQVKQQGPFDFNECLERLIANGNRNADAAFRCHFLMQRQQIAAQNVRTCSGNLGICKSGVASRGQPDDPCRDAFAQCMKTGVWQTHGQYGRRVEGVVRN
jgi:hypothetical protein